MLGRAVGLRGELRLRLDADADAATLAELGELWIEGLGSVAVHALRRQGRRWVVRLAGVRRRERAEALVGARVFAPEAALPATEGPTPGAEVVLGGATIGSVTALRRGPQELVVIRVGDGEALLPLAAPYVRWDGRTLTLIDPPEGLLP